MNAYLILEDGTVLQGKSFGATKEVISEIVFNTSMTGYLEVLTDPSYAGQAVTMTYPMIGNYGVCTEDMESGKAWCDAMIVREVSRTASNFRNEQSLDAFMKEQGIVGIEGIDTRALTRRLREKGTMNGMITTNENYNLEEILPNIHAYSVTGVVKATSCKEIYEATLKEATWSGIHPLPYRTKKPYKVAFMDFGAKENIVQSLLKMGCEVTVYPEDTKAEVILNDKPDGIMLSNGPGDPKECVEIIEQLKTLYESDVPIFAICLGHQLMALATGANTRKMRYGHRGANHPVKDIRTGKVYISTQNHGYVVTEDSLDETIAVPAFYNVNDKTIEGLAYVNKPIVTVQFHPEACAGPKDAEFLFGEFLQMMEDKRSS